MEILKAICTKKQPPVLPYILSSLQWQRRYKTLKINGHKNWPFASAHPISGDSCIVIAFQKGFDFSLLKRNAENRVHLWKWNRAIYSFQRFYQFEQYHIILLKSAIYVAGEVVVTVMRIGFRSLETIFFRTLSKLVSSVVYFTFQMPNK